MGARRKLTALILAGHHHYTGMFQATDVTDAKYVQVDVPELPWLEHIEIDLSADSVAVKITPTDPDGRPYSLRVHRDGGLELT